MIYDKKKNRFLKKNGVSIISVQQYCQYIVEQNDLPSDKVAIIEEEEGKKAEDLLDRPILTDTEEAVAFNNEINRGMDIKKEKIYERVATSPRKRIDDSDLERIDYELKFFFKENYYIDLLNQLIGLVDDFEESGVLWMGRGSSCSSYVLYLLKVHDIDALKWDIPFNELTKEE